MDNLTNELALGTLSMVVGATQRRGQQLCLTTRKLFFGLRTGHREMKKKTQEGALYNPGPGRFWFTKNVNKQKSEQTKK